MYLKRCCPICGVHTLVPVSNEELRRLKQLGIYPKDIDERSICDCCKDERNE